VPQKAFQPLTYLLVRKIFVAFKSFFAKINRFEKLEFFLEMPCHNLLNQLVRIPALLRSGLHKLLGYFGSEMDFHKFRLRKRQATSNQIHRCLCVCQYEDEFQVWGEKAIAL
jgi:hypothetical protein